ncbi:MAG: serine hydroxymethyltransferase [Planctomycetota bacterium]
MIRLKDTDPEILAAMMGELIRQRDFLELIASENYVSEAVLVAQGSVMTNKYAEGYPGKRYYGGCKFVDVAETLAIERVKKLFGADRANVQPHSGTQANMAVLQAFLKPGETILSMNLAHGGHLSHGHKLNFSGRLYTIVSYGVSREDERIDYGQMEELARKHRPKMIIAGASAYPRFIDYARFEAIAREVGAYLMVDIAHVAGMVTVDLHPNPVPHSDFVTLTTHKTMRGPRGGIILCKKQYAEEIDRSLFPGIQGGPMMHTIAGKAVALKEAMLPGFKVYQYQILQNATCLCESIMKEGFRIVTGGTDNHLFLVDIEHTGLTGKEAEVLLDEVGITVNKNLIPFDKRPPAQTGGIRIGTPALTTRGMGTKEMAQVGSMVARVLLKPTSRKVHKEVNGEIAELVKRFPIYQDMYNEITRLNR